MHTDDQAGDAELITRYRAGDDDAATELFERHHAPARRFASRLAGRSAADDLAAEAFSRVLAALRNGRGPDVAFRPYLMTSVRNAHIKTGQRDNKIVWVDEYEPLGNQAAAEDETDLRSESSLLAQAFSSLPERWQTVLWHTSVEDEPREEVARLLGITPAAVGALAYRAREGLRQAYLSAHISTTDDAVCQGVREKLAAYSRGQLGPRDTATVEQHVDDCRDCALVLADLRGITSDLPALLVPALLGGSGAAWWGGRARGRSSQSRPRGTSSSAGRRAIAGTRTRLAAAVSSPAGAIATLATGVAAAAVIAVMLVRPSDPGTPSEGFADAGPVRTPVEQPRVRSESPTAAPVPDPVPELPVRPEPVPVVPPAAPAPQAEPPSEPESKPPPRPSPEPTPEPSPEPEPEPEPEPTGTTYDLAVGLANLAEGVDWTTFDLVVSSPDGPSTLVIDVTSAGGWNFGSAPPVGADCTAPSGDTPVQITCTFADAFDGTLSFMLLDQVAGSAFTASISAADNTDPTPGDATVSYSS